MGTERRPRVKMNRGAELTPPLWEPGAMSHGRLEEKRLFICIPKDESHSPDRNKRRPFLQSRVGVEAWLFGRAGDGQAVGLLSV